MLSANQQRALAALLASRSRTEAAAKCRLTAKTLQLYEKQPEFAEALAAGRRQLHTDAAQRIAAGYTETVDELQAIVHNPASADSAKVAAARALLDYGLRFAEITDINERLDELERRLG